MHVQRMLTAVLVGVLLTLTGWSEGVALAEPGPDGKGTASADSGTLAYGPFWWATANSPTGERWVLDVRGPTTAEFAKVHLWEYYGGNSQYWYMDYVASSGGHNIWYLRNAYSNKCMDLQGTGIANGTQVVQETCDGSSGQRWRQEYMFESDGKQMYRFVNLRARRCLDNQSGTTVLGNKIQVWGCGANNWNQMWW